MTNACVVLSGCSGGGKSMLLHELARRGYPVVAEPGRRIIAEEEQAGGHAVPWRDLQAFLHRAGARAMADRQAAEDKAAWTFFDRGLVDALAARKDISFEEALRLAGQCRYRRKVFLTPPWADIYMQDSMRRHDFAAACAEYDLLVQAYPAFGYETVIIPKDSVAARADFILRNLAD